MLIPGLSAATARAADSGPQDRLSLAGYILNTEGRGVKEADQVLVNGPARQTGRQKPSWSRQRAVSW
jgi:hypothetical protein